MNDVDSGGEQTIKLVLFGGSCTGKTSLVLRFLENKFDEKYVETSEDVFQRQFRFRDRKLNVHFIDLGGANEYPAIRRVHLGSADAFILTCSVDAVDSLQALKSCWAEIETTKRGPEQLKKIPFVVVMTKADLAFDDNRVLAIKQQLAADIDTWIDGVIENTNRTKSLLYTETSAKTVQNIKAPFEKLILQYFSVSHSLDVTSSPKLEARGQSQTIGVLAAQMASKDLAPGSPKRGFSFNRKKERPKDSLKIDSKEDTPDNSKTLNRSKGLSRSFIFRGAGKSNKTQSESGVPADEECLVQ